MTIHLANRKTITLIIAILVITLACATPALQREAGTPAASTPQVMTGDTPEAPEDDPLSESPAGAVYELPTADSRKQTANLCATVTAIEALHLRAKPDEKAEHLSYMLNGEQVKVIDIGDLLSKSWWKVETAAGAVGYANAKYLQEAACK